MITFLIVIAIFGVLALIFLPRPETETIFSAIAFGVVLFWLTFWGVVIYVAHHFITKYW